MGGDERAATHALVALIADNPAALRALAALLVACGRVEAAGIVARAAGSHHTGRRP